MKCTTARGWGGKGRLAAGVLLALSTGGSALAGVTTTSGTALLIGPSLNEDLNLGQSESGAVQVFEEQRSVEVGGLSPLFVDYVITTTDINSILTGQPSPGANPRRSMLPEGVYDSHLLHFDPIGPSSGSVANATVTFDGDIVAIIVNHVDLAAADPVLGDASAFASVQDRGAELNDRVRVDAPDRLTVRIFNVGTEGMDEVRVLTLPGESPDPMADSDGDGVTDEQDQCPGFDDSADRDVDGLPDACDACPDDDDNDLDLDGFCGNFDVCPFTWNPDQLDSDGDGDGDACDVCPADPNDDIDGDGVCGDTDNCPGDSNADQLDADADGAGDACDVCPLDAGDDADGDGLCGDVDNCPDHANADQADGDLDGQGDACDDDDDGDGVMDADDACPSTLSGEPVNSSGCSIDDTCPCDGSWRRRGEYVRCVAAASLELVREGALSVLDFAREILAAVFGAGDCV